MIGRAVVIGLAVVGCIGRPRPTDGRLPADSLFAHGDSLYQAQRFDSARTIWRAALEGAEAVGDSATMARALTEIAFADYRLGDLARARHEQQRALDLKIRRRLGDSALSRSYNGLGLVATHEGRHREAVGHFERAIEAARAAGDVAGLARASGNIGLPLASLGELERAREAHRTLREAGRRLGNPRFEGNGLLNEATLDIWEGDAGVAIARLDTARRLYREASYATGEHWVLGQLATAFELTGEMGQAFGALDSALRLARTQGLRDEEADDLRLIGGLHAEVGDWRRAIRYYQQADSMFRLTGSASGQGSALRGAAAGYHELGNDRRAITTATEAVRLHAAAGETLEELDDWLLLAAIEGNLTPAVAERSLATARTLARSLDTRDARLRVALAEARHAGRRGSPSVALSAAAAVGRELTAADAWAEWEFHALAARANARLGRLDSAVVEGRLAVRAIERQRGNLASETLRTTLVSERADVYGDLILALLRLDRSEEAFVVADAARGRALLEHLAEVRVGPLPDLRRRDELLRRIDRLMERIRSSEPSPRQERGPGPDPSADLLRELGTARSEFEALLTRIGDSPSVAAAVLGAGRVQTDAVRQALGPDELLLEYLLTPNRLLIFVVSRDGLHVLDRARNATVLNHQVELIRGLWGSTAEDWRLGLPVAKALHQALIEPVLDARLLDDRRRLLIVPHGVLGQLPFAALWNGRTERFLVEDYSIIHLPSAAALAVLRQRAGAAAAPPGGEGLAPFPSELPATAGEVEAYRSARPGSVARLGPAASEAALRLALGQPGIVHVASHGVLNDRNPMFSRIELAPSSRPGRSSDDGRLEVHELLGLEIVSQLVFLSGCETGAGPGWRLDPISGSADLSLAQAALAAGANNVVSTLWRIRDAGGAAFARRFYAGLGAGSAAAALAGAQRAFLADPDHASPFYWAGYTLSGAGWIGPKPQDMAGPTVSPSSSLTRPGSGPPRSNP